MDTAFLFEMFVEMVRGNPARLTLLDPMVYQPSQSPARKVLFECGYAAVALVVRVIEFQVSKYSVFDLSIHSSLAPRCSP